MLEKALAEDPDNVDVQVALAALLMRGVQMVWLSPAERERRRPRPRRHWSRRCGQSPITSRRTRPIAASSTPPTSSAQASWPARGP